MRLARNNGNYMPLWLADCDPIDSCLGKGHQMRKVAFSLSCSFMRYKNTRLLSPIQSEGDITHHHHHHHNNVNLTTTNTITSSP